MIREEARTSPFNQNLWILFAAVTGVGIAMDVQAGKKPGKSKTTSFHANALALETLAFCQNYRLTPRESEVVQVLAEGITRIKDIADRLRLSPNTVNNHVNSIFMKTKTRSKSQLLAMLLTRISEELQWARLFRRCPRVVLATQDDELAENLSSALSGQGFVVDVTRTQSETECQLGVIAAHFAVVDLSSGTIDGREFLRKVSAKSSVQVLFLGRTEDLTDRCKAMDAGAIDLLEVPTSIEQVAQVVQMMVTHYIENDVDRARFLDIEKTVDHKCKGHLEISARNIGRGGIFLSKADLEKVFGEPVCNGDLVELKLTTGDFKKPMVAKGQIVWLRSESSGAQAGAGVRLLQLVNCDPNQHAEFKSEWMELLNRNSIITYIPAG
jgi:DNA-binding NarL/FixJ family response regulator